MDCLRKNFIEGALLNNGRYETISPLNHGSFGMVFMAKDTHTDNRVAIKCLTKPSAAKDVNCPLIVDDKSEELAIHTRAGSHPNIVNLVESFETETHTYLVMEYCSMGDLYEAIRQDKGPKKTEHVRDFMLQLVDAIQYLHSRGLYHRDIKPENIFLTENGDMKLGDFGLATADIWSYESSVGSDRYMAPEQYETSGNGLSPAKADVWSVGICLLNILFSRNPFGTPSVSDPLFADFVCDRQSLFDVFPNMSQDTFEVLIHCLAVDPEKRSLSLVKEALQRVISFTTDDESLDEFCTEDREVPISTANREPLRTPSVSSPNMGPGDAFPWAKALHMTSPQKMGAIGRALSVIHDTDTPSEDLFPGSEASTQDWFSKADTQSIESVVDSGLGVSIGSSEFQHSPSANVTRSKPVPIAGSLPSLRGSTTSALASIFGGLGKKKAFESKSWSELWEEEEEEREMMQQEEQKQVTSMARPTARFQMPKIANLTQEDSEDDGRSTPRACLRELRNPVSMYDLRRPNSQDSIRSSGEMGKDDRVSEQTGFMFEEHSPASSTPRYSPPQSAKRSIIDKWAALGDKRRGANNPMHGGSTPTPTPASVAVSTPTKDNATARDFSSPTDSGNNRRRFRASTWRRGMFNRQASTPAPPMPSGHYDHSAANGRYQYRSSERGLDHAVWTQPTKEWSLSKDWRKSEHHLPLSSSQADAKQADSFQPHASQLDGATALSPPALPLDIRPKTSAADSKLTEAGGEESDLWMGVAVGTGGWRSRALQT